MAARYFSILIIAAFILAFYVWQQTQAVRLGYKVDGVKKECETWEQENKTWRLKINTLLSMERLDKVAKARKLIVPDDKRKIYLSD
ncbi:MAG: hypothetical protein JW803_02510 [Endomicrobiales bacterium]|nr:hypothetical protein [Endomicrobiales bacterium]